MGLTLLHLSDIHFRDYKGNDYLDLDKDIQNEIERDLENLKAEYKKIDVFLIGGDIAFSGKKEEYEVADSWIERVCEITECDVENVLTIPGNHDVDRDRITDLIQDIHDKFRSLKERTQIDYKLSRYLKVDDSANLLLSPFSNYNNFAQKYDSIPQGNNLLFWEKDFLLDGSTLRIRGVNSALISNSSDDEHSNKLLLGSQQSLIKNFKGVINVILCHHPPSWLFDGQHVEADLKNRARIHFFGHKHAFNADIINNHCLVLSAGAMQPSRFESDWEPRYNIIELDIPKVLTTQVLSIKLYKRIWDKHTRKFKADYSEHGDIFVEYNLPLTKDEISPVLSKPLTQENIKKFAMAENVTDTNNPNPIRKLAYLFLGLAYHQKVTIAVNLELVEETDRDLSETRRGQLYFKRAIERGLSSELWDRVMEYSDSQIKNPFIK